MLYIKYQAQKSLYDYSTANNNSGGPITKPAISVLQNTPSYGTLFTEALRREKVIQSLTENLKYVVGSIVKPVSEKDIKKYGKEHVVVNICDSYAKYGKNETWPDNDNPMLVEIETQDEKKQHFWCTTNFIDLV